ncbi:MAG: ABC transporter substrate-binding protein, partial [Rhizobacter sp.]|nr:ABC transporter substrate-binding protein [Rhizobacter sp.]
MNARGGRDDVRVGRRLALALAGAAALGAGRAASQPRIVRVGVLVLSPPPTPQHPEPMETGFLHGLRDLGYVEGKTLIVERRWDSRSDRLAAMAAELVRLKVDVIIAAGQPAREAARKATSTISILALSGGDPVREGWAQSLARPGGNVTGLTFTFPELVSKRLELLKEVSPAARDIVVLIDPAEVVDATDVIRETKSAAERLGMKIEVVEMRGPEDVDVALEAVRRHRPQVLYPIAMYPHRARIAALAGHDRLPTIGESTEEAKAGLLMAYGVETDELVRRGVAMLAKI